MINHHMGPILATGWYPHGTNQNSTAKAELLLKLQDTEDLSEINWVKLDADTKTFFMGFKKDPGSYHIVSKYPGYNPNLLGI